MSVWYDIKVTVIAETETAVAKFFNLNDSWEDVRTDSFDFSFGGKNAPGLTLHKIVKQHPNLIFLVRQSIECNTVQYYLMRFDQSSNKEQCIFVEDSGDYNEEINKRILEEYSKEYPTLVAKHFANEKGFQGFRWTMFFSNFARSAAMLNDWENYQEMTVYIDADGFSNESDEEQNKFFNKNDY